MNKIIKRKKEDFGLDCHTYIMHRLGFVPDPSKEESRKPAIYIATILQLLCQYCVNCVLRRTLEIDYLWWEFEHKKFQIKPEETYNDVVLTYISSRLTDPENDWTPSNDWNNHSIEEKKDWVDETLSILANSNAKEAISKIIEIDNLYSEFENKFGSRYKNK